MDINNKLIQSESDLPIRLLIESDEIETVVFHLKGGVTEIPPKEAVLNLLLWYPLIQKGIELHKNDIFHFPTINKGLISDFNTHVYHRLISSSSATKNERLQLIWESINRLQNVIMTHLNQYHQTIDLIGLEKIRNHDKVKELTNIRLDPNEGSAAAENKAGVITQELNKILSDPNTLPDNQLLPFMMSGNIKLSQLPQIFAAYGPRSDVDGTIKKHFVSESSMSGLKNVYDYAIETIAAKKSQYESTDTIAKSQAFGRVLRIVCSAVKHVHPGWCGNSKTIQYRINEANAESCLYNSIIEENGDRVILTPNNIEQYINSQVDLVSPITCHYSDGFCEGCAGWGYGMANEYLPNVNIGEHSATRFVNKSSQTILSSKHKEATESKEYKLDSSLKNYFNLINNTLVLRKDIVNKALKFRIPLSDLRPLTDLQEKYSHLVNSFSKLNCIQVVDKKNKFVEELALDHPFYLLYLSKAVLDKLSSKKKLETDEYYLYVSFSDLPRKDPMIRMISLSHDMNSFIEKLRSFFKYNTGLPSYTSVSAALNDFSDFIYGKMQINLFYLQVILKSFLIEESTSSVPYVFDPENVRFGTDQIVCSKRGVGMELAFGSYRSLINRTSSFVEQKGSTEYDYFFNLK